MLQRAETPATLAGVDAARAFFAGCTDPHEGKNNLWVAHLDEGAHCLHLSVYPDGAGAAVLPTRAILTDAARIGSTGLILAHHQRGGARLLGKAERIANRQLAEAAEACDITLLDHLVLAGDHCTSLRRMGVL